MRRMIVATFLLLAMVGGVGWGGWGAGPRVAHAAPACSKVDLCLSIQSDGNTWWIALGGQHLMAGTYVTYNYISLSGGGFGAVLVKANNGSLSSTVVGGVCPAGTISASASGTTSKGVAVSASASGMPC